MHVVQRWYADSLQLAVYSLWHREYDPGARTFGKRRCGICCTQHPWAISLLSVPGTLRFWSGQGYRWAGGHGLLSEARRFKLDRKRSDPSGLWTEYPGNALAGGNRL